MNDSTAQKTTTESTPEPVILLSWVSHPLKRSTGKSAVAVSAVVISVIFGAWYMESYLFGALAGLVMFGSLAKFFLPTTYTFDVEGVTVKTTTHTLTRPWSMFRSFYTDKNGVLLSPFIGPSRLENFRGLYITFADNRESVLQIVAAQVVTPAEVGDVAVPSTTSEKGNDS